MGLSTSAGALPEVLALCPPGIRVAAWHKGERVTRSKYALNAWEPVIYHGGRQLPGALRRADSIVCGVTPVSTRSGHVIGAKPAAVCRWIFALLGACPGDTLDDLFPGSGAVSRAWTAYTSSEASRHGYPSSQARADASPPAASYGSYPSYEASHDAYPPLPAAPGTFHPGRGPCPPLPLIGLTAADLFAGAKVSRIDSRVH